MYDIIKYPNIARWSIFVPIFTFIVLIISNLNSFEVYDWLLVLGVLVWATWHMFATKLILKTSDLGILYQLKPSDKKEKLIPFNVILETEIFAMDFMTKFSGWGKRKRKNEIAYIFNDGYFLKVKTEEMTYYFSISDNCKVDWQKWETNYKNNLRL